MKRIKEKKQETHGLINNRIIQYDYLRIFATLAVMMIHVAAQNWYNVDVTSFEWQVFNFYDSIGRWSLPIFIMISGALFLNQDYSIKKIYSVNILRIVTAFVFWSTIYALVRFIQGATIKDALEQIIEGPYHMWFLIMIVGQYAIVPFVKKIVESDVLMRYFLILSFVFTFLISDSVKLLSVISLELGDLMNGIISTLDFHFAIGYVFYFVLGYYLINKKLSCKIRYLSYILCMIGFISTVVLSSFVSQYRHEATTAFFSNFRVNIMLESIGMFVFFKYAIPRIQSSPKWEIIIIKLSRYCFGAYLVHAMIIEQLRNILGVDTLDFNAILSIPVITCIVFVVSFSISFVLNQIPVLKKYIV